MMLPTVKEAVEASRPIIIYYLSLGGAVAVAVANIVVSLPFPAINMASYCTRSSGVPCLQRSLNRPSLAEASHRFQVSF